MKLATICLCLMENEVLLGIKKKGFGVGKWNGYGGKVRKSDLKISSAARRELREESKLRVRRNSLKQFALIQFFFAQKPAFECHVFVVKSKDLIGKPGETREMKNHTWFPFDKVFYDEMWPADRLWMPLVFSGKKIKGRVDFNAEGNSVENFSYEEIEFD